MALADDLRKLRDYSLAALDASHNYYAHSQAVWHLLDVSVTEGRKFTLHNPTTGLHVDEQSLLDLSSKYLANYLRAFTFQHFVSLFEDFFFDLLRLWLAAFPGSLSAKQIDFGTILQAPDKAAITLAVVDRDLNELKYKRVADWFAYLEKLVKLGCPSAEEVERIAEIKASRDILAHNKGIANAIYVAKAGTCARYRAGETLEIPQAYHRESWETLRKVVQDVSEAAVGKL